jgi:hypothetical protein
VIASKLSDRGANRRFVALEKRLVEIHVAGYRFPVPGNRQLATGNYFRLFFAAAFGLAAAGGGVDAVVIPSDSERLSSTSTVCVIVSVPSGAGLAAAGAIVCVVGPEAAAPLL